MTIDELRQRAYERAGAGDTVCGLCAVRTIRAALSVIEEATGLTDADLEGLMARKAPMRWEKVIGQWPGEETDAQVDEFFKDGRG